MMEKKECENLIEAHKPELRNFAIYRLTGIYNVDDAKLLLDNVINDLHIDINDDNNPPQQDSDIEIIKSNLDEKIKKYNNCEVEEEKNFLSELEKLRNTLNDLSCICPDYLIRWFKNLGIFSKENFIEDIIEIRDDLKRLIEKYPIKGEYNHKTKTIILYTKNIDDSLDLKAVFAHEFFHAVHFALLETNESKEINNLTEYYHSVVLESLAEYFSLEYINYFWNSYKEKYCSIVWPKRGVEYLYEYVVAPKWVDVLKLTFSSFEGALRKMIYNPGEIEILLQKEPDYYAIKRK